MSAVGGWGSSNVDLTDGEGGGQGGGNDGVMIGVDIVLSLS